MQSKLFGEQVNTQRDGTRIFSLSILNNDYSSIGFTIYMYIGMLRPNT